MKNTGLIIIGSIVGIFTLFAIIFGIMLLSTSNQSVRMVNEITTAKANINKEQNRRVKLFGNLVDAAKSYNDYESETLDKLTEARTKAENGDVENAKVTLNAVAEAYPDLKSQKNYETTMTEFTHTENRLANYIESYNGAILAYNNFSQTFPNSLFLGMTGHPHQEFKQTELEVNPEDGDNLFSK